MFVSFNLRVPDAVAESFLANRFRSRGQVYEVERADNKLAKFRARNARAARAATAMVEQQTVPEALEPVSQWSLEDARKDAKAAVARVKSYVKYPKLPAVLPKPATPSPRPAEQAPPRAAQPPAQAARKPPMRGNTVWEPATSARPLQLSEAIPSTPWAEVSLTPIPCLSPILPAEPLRKNTVIHELAPVEDMAPSACSDTPAPAASELRRSVSACTDADPVEPAAPATPTKTTKIAVAAEDVKEVRLAEMDHNELADWLAKHSSRKFSTLAPVIRQDAIVGMDIAHFDEDAHEMLEEYLSKAWRKKLFRELKAREERLQSLLHPQSGASRQASHDGRPW